MEKIYFDNLRNNFWLGIFILSCLCLLVGIFEIIEFSNSDINGYIRKAGFLLQAIYLSKMFWYRNYIQWNKIGAVIRVNSVFGKSFKFSEVQSSVLHDKILTIALTNGEKIKFNLNRISESEIHKLNEILIKNTMVNNLS